MSNEYEEKVTLISSDGKSFEVSLSVAKMANTLKDLIEDAGAECPVPLPNVTEKILEKVIKYCEYHIEHPVTPEPEEELKEKRSDDISPWDREFCNVDQSTLFEMILAANYLNIQEMLDVTCKTVANMIKGKTPDEIRKTFNIENDFTPEEEEAIKKENEWCEER